VTTALSDHQEKHNLGTVPVGGSWNSTLSLTIVGQVVRQRPPAAKGFVFITLEDEDGLMNLIVRPVLTGPACTAVHRQVQNWRCSPN